MTAQFATHRLRTRNRFFRVVLSRHVRDLKLIALLATAMVTIIIVFLGNMLLIPTTNTDALAATRGTAPTPPRGGRKIVRVHRSRVRAAAARAAAFSALLLPFGSGYADIAVAEPANACTANSGPDILAAVAGSNIPRVQAVPSFNLAPIGGPTAIGLRRTFEPKDPKDKVDNYRVIVQFGAKPKPENTAFADGLQVSAIEPSETSPLRTSGYIGQHDTLLELTTPVPGISRGLRGWGWHDGLITVVACSGKQPVFIAAFPTVFSDRLTCIVMTGFVTIVIYLSVSKAVSTWDNKPRPADGKIKWRRYLDPVMMSSGPNGKGSLSRLQVLFFTILLFFVLLYIVLRVGFLSDMSPTVLLLLGISGIGAAASKAADVGLNRIDFSNWVWMIGKGWLPANGPASVTVASWRDIVTADDGFDVYHFQMLIFSLVVGVALLQVGFTDLSTFTVPEALLAVLGLSQAVYVGGKLVSSPAPGDLDKAVTELRTRETNFVKAVISNTAASATAASDLTQARARAPTEFSAYGEQQELVKGMFKSVFGDFQPGATFDPRFR